MNGQVSCGPFNEEPPVIYAGRLNRMISAAKIAQQKQLLGQYFTREDIAGFAARLSSHKSAGRSVRILDPGAGTAILSCALIEELKNKINVAGFELVCYEVDKLILPYTKMVLEYLKTHLEKNNIRLRYKLLNEDFILNNSKLFLPDSKIEEQFDIVISNPPFFKLKPRDERIKYTEQIIAGQPNIYSLFLYAACRMLKQGGEFIFIVPRSFCSASYFKIFRNNLLQFTQIENIRHFTNGSMIFDEHGMLNDTVIVKGTKNNKPPENYFIETSALNSVSERTNTYRHYFNINKNVIPLPKTEDEAYLFEKYKSMKSSLNESGFIIAGGSVLKSDIEKFVVLPDQKDNVAVPVILLKNLNQNNFTGQSAGGNGFQYIKCCSETKHLIIENRSMILLRRYNKQVNDKKIIAVPYFKEYANYDRIAVDKQLLYISKKGAELDITELLKITEILNSAELNTYLNMISGGINISADDIMAIPFPADCFSG